LRVPLVANGWRFSVKPETALGLTEAMAFWPPTKMTIRVRNLLISGVIYGHSKAVAN